MRLIPSSTPVRVSFLGVSCSERIPCPVPAHPQLRHGTSVVTLTRVSLVRARALFGDEPSSCGGRRTPRKSSGRSTHIPARPSVPMQHAPSPSSLLHSRMPQSDAPLSLSSSFGSRAHLMRLAVVERPAGLTLEATHTTQIPRLPAGASADRPEGRGNAGQLAQA